MPWISPEPPERSCSRWTRPEPDLGSRMRRVPLSLAGAGVVVGCLLAGGSSGATAQGLSTRPAPTTTVAATAERLAATKNQVIVLTDELEALGHENLCG